MITEPYAIQRDAARPRPTPRRSLRNADILAAEPDSPGRCGGRGARLDGVTASAAAIPVGGFGQRVLVVDDDPTVAEVVAGYLHRAGFVVDRVTDGPAAVVRAAAVRPGLGCWT